MAKEKAIKEKSVKEHLAGAKDLHDAIAKAQAAGFGWQQILAAILAALEGLLNSGTGSTGT